jgi:hypothetical protein
MTIECEDAENTTVVKGESVLVPAQLDKFILRPKSKSKILEVYIQ